MQDAGIQDTGSRDIESLDIESQPWNPTITFYLMQDMLRILPLRVLWRRRLGLPILYSANSEIVLPESSHYRTFIDYVAYLTETRPRDPDCAPLRAWIQNARQKFGGTYYIIVNRKLVIEKLRQCAEFKWQKNTLKRLSKAEKENSPTREYRVLNVIWSISNIFCLVTSHGIAIPRKWYATTCPVYEVYGFEKYTYTYSPEIINCVMQLDIPNDCIILILTYMDEEKKDGVRIITDNAVCKYYKKYLLV